MRSGVESCASHHFSRCAARAPAAYFTGVNNITEHLPESSYPPTFQLNGFRIYKHPYNPFTGNERFSAAPVTRRDIGGWFSSARYVHLGEPLPESDASWRDNDYTPGRLAGIAGAARSGRQAIGTLI